jgi:hypothetical protein
MFRTTSADFKIFLKFLKYFGCHILARLDRELKEN